MVLLTIRFKASQLPRSSEVFSCSHRDRRIGLTPASPTSRPHPRYNQPFGANQ
ncbi:hypothetical protein RISK_003496 [Rhodopirellula islandica]|uniref:Uncharacterized protein n=1 Tax=Rhodopirellula islandica TaxID=595434 RepID=A0A0J1BCW8_RHOIS|nr:hypothetical protein RISK_003496 [Rhodopirellula islandica]